ncbi:T9SS type A sorting domain-containing protein [Flavobacterium sp. Sd200]|uniref:T9SS type A sorting domain-containing protein n=1 Tax=Flavobacterium sp. Sd200 TaxID=2692211 RepID=UPI0013701832|nr:T9SS type A sorting domain-containing protein [Flavobacterium sp. Sd200]MXN90912.1 T9SS type A sorting domain-containing protein [Flavobacterium sp. Sd200]
MKTKLLLLSLVFGTAAFSQGFVRAFYAFTAEGLTDNYTIVESSVDLNEAASTGANVIWNFNNLTALTSTSTMVIPPSASDIATYPGSTMLVQSTKENGDVTRYFFVQNLTDGILLAGAETTGFTLNYITNNAFIMNFPLSYGGGNHEEPDAVAGTFQYGTYNGTFTGTISTFYESFGTLTVNVGSANNTPAMRLKTVQNLTLTVFGIQVGTATQTMYSYYGENLLTGPLFRSITTDIDVPLGGIDSTTTVYESYETTAMSIPQVAKSKASLAPNPVNDVLHFAGIDNINNITVMDATGRIVLTGNGNNVSANSLNKGVYYATAQTETGKQTVKFIKK